MDVKEDELTIDLPTRLMLAGTEDYQKPMDFTGFRSTEFLFNRFCKDDTDAQAEKFVKEFESVCIKHNEGLDDSIAELKSILKSNGILEDDLETTYTHAYSMFQANSFKNALLLFKGLYLVSPYEYKYGYALGRTLQKLDYHHLAVEVFNQVIIMHPKELDPIYWCAESYYSLKHIEMYLKLLEYLLFKSKKLNYKGNLLVERSAAAYDCACLQIKEMMENMSG